MHKVITALASIAALILSPSVLGADNPQFLFSKIKVQARHVERAKLVVDTNLPSASWVFSSNTPEEGCTVYLHTQLVRALNTAMLAVLMAHEVSHCELDHHRQFREASEAELTHKQWEFEYEADGLALKLVRRLDIDERNAFAQLMTIFPDDPAHPPGAARLKALRTGEREYPQASEPLVAQGAAAAP